MIHQFFKDHGISEAIKLSREYLNIPATIPFEFPYDPEALRSNCENIVGYIPVPVGVAGPLMVDGIQSYIPLATTEGALVASINRGCKLLEMSGGVKTVQADDGMTRGPVLRFPNISEAHRMEKWLSSHNGFIIMQEAFNATSRYAKLKKISVRQVGRLLYIRIKATTGEAMGMNMLGKGTEAAILRALEDFPSGELLSLSGNYCTDKKASAVNWIEGRGKSVVAEAFISAEQVKNILHCVPERLYAVYQSKCMIGSMVSGALGGCNAHTANIVAACFLATGQDVAQVTDSSFCLTSLEILPNGSMHASVTMPCIQIGCVGGGTSLAPQKASLFLLTGAEFQINDHAGDSQRASRAARVLSAAVLAGELSLLGSLAEGSLMRAHLSLNRARDDNENNNCPK